MTTRQVVTRVRIAGKSAAKKLIEATDAALVAQGKAARIRQRKRAVRAAVRRVVTSVAIVGAAAATVVAAKAVRARRPRSAARQ